MKDKYANRIKDLKAAQGFIVTGEKERAKVLKSAKEMQKFGAIDFEVSTREVEPGKFKVVAI
jgi:hypothetical protein